MAKGKLWQADELLVLFHIYCQIPFGRFNRSNRELAIIATKMDRTIGSLVRKAGNFASLDSSHRARNVGGLPNRSRADEELWERFSIDPSGVALEAAEAFEQLIGSDFDSFPSIQSKEDGLTWSASDRRHLNDLARCTPPSGPTEAQALRRIRRVQSFFRRAVLSGYKYRCAITGITIPDLINASHIIPWSADESRRADPTNGIALNCLHDRAFDRGLISFDDEMRLIVSPQMKKESSEFEESAREFLLQSEKKTLTLPERFAPDKKALALHRTSVFVA